MPSTSETGHAKNVANFEDLISFCTGYGTTYNPSNTSLSVSSLSSLLNTAQKILNEAKTTEVAFNNATNSRMDAFRNLKTLSTRLVNALDATNASDQTVKDAKTINRKIQGQRATPAPPADPGSPPTPNKTISTSQQSYDQLIEHFSRLIDLLSAESGYKPNENELQIANLATTLAGLKTANTAVSNSYASWSNSRIKRADVLYNISNGLVTTALDTKKYVKSVFGTSSPQFKQVSGLEFKTVRV